ncbi:protein ANTI-SILENCING 1 isoform X4 [Rhododendron vialii]|uniref:protein ANTI-SILENCING 1 isoform X4 n=1 Tax=Rhododendron vialii TaxID=182163 RepID=UPI00265FA051|nr:protein ANTI-SILENCING 1 isoform X4 [Rhododendron vialii]
MKRCMQMKFFWHQEAIAGKCNVVCISKDSRNPQPSEQELQMADYVFSRTFDVRHCTISDQMDDKVAGLAVKVLFVKKEEPLEFKTERTEGNLNGLVPRGSEDVKDSLVGRKSLPDVKPACGAALATASGRQVSLAGDKATMYGTESDKNEMKRSKLPADHVEAEDKGKSSQDSGALENKASKSSTADGSVKFSESRNIDRKVTVNGNDAKALVTSTTSTKKKPKTVPGKDFLGSDKGVKSAKDTGALDDRPSKKARVDCSVKLSENNNDIGGQKLSLNSDRNKGKELAAPLTSGGALKAGVSSHWLDKDPKQKTDEKTSKLSNGKLLKVSARNCQGENRIPEGDASEVTPKPADVRGNWFRQLPWEQRMITAQEQGTLVQLSNLDPACTSKQVEDIIWHAFKENCTAKMVQHTAISSPHSGQAFIILKTRGAAERIITELDDRCLMLSNRSPLVGSVPPPRSVQKKSAFVGHLSIDIIKHQMQREWKEALSTSHYSQPNNMEYEMAMEWCLLQSRSKLWWNKFYKIQGEELRKLKANLKMK